MKNAFLAFLMFTGAAVYAQKVSPNLTAAVKDSPVKTEESIALPSQSLSFYSTNYFRIFGYEQYTFDTMAFKSREVFVSSDNRFYSNGAQNMPGVLPSDPVLSYYDAQCNGGTAAVGAAVVGIGTFAAIKNWMDGTKDYTPKVDKAAFDAAGRGE